LKATQARRRKELLESKELYNTRLSKYTTFFKREAAKTSGSSIFQATNSLQTVLQTNSGNTATSTKILMNGERNMTRKRKCTLTCMMPSRTSLMKDQGIKMPRLKISQGDQRLSRDTRKETD
jgi:Sec7-like guanine-nucleotide exchange factor